MSPKRKSPFAGFKSVLIQYLNFTLPERKGIFLFITFQFILIIILLYVKFTEPVNAVDFSKLDSTVVQYDALYRVTSPKEPFNTGRMITDTLKKESAPQQLFMFNPNKLTDSLWQQLGLSDKQIRTIKNYENKGGRFYSKADVKKMYCISEEEYVRLAPFIDLPETRPGFKNDSTYKVSNKTTIEKKVTQVSPIEINVANEEDLIAIPGIGPGRASSIISYRNKLGGYVELAQVKEAFGMDSVYDSVKKYLLLEIYTTRRININTSIPAELKHPYITTGLANIIVNYRKAHGDYTDVSDLKKLEMLNQDLYKKLSPYLKVK